MNAPLITQKAGKNKPEIQELPKQSALALVAVGITLLLGLSKIVGVILNHPEVIVWPPDNVPFRFLAALSLVLLVVSYLLQWYNRDNAKKTMTVAAFLAALSVLGIAAFEVFNIFQNGLDLTLRQYMLPISGSAGNLPIYSILGLLLASITTLFNLMVRPKGKLFILGVQVPSLVLISLATYGFLESLGDVLLFRHLVSLPVSLALLTYGLAMAMFPREQLHLLRSVFSASPWIKFYMGLIVLGWFATAVWQTIGTNRIVSATPINLAEVTMLILEDDIIEVIISSALLILGLHILQKLDENMSLSRRLKEAFHHYGLLAATLSHDLKAPVKAQIEAIEDWRLDSL